MLLSGNKKAHRRCNTNEPKFASFPRGDHSFSLHPRSIRHDKGTGAHKSSPAKGCIIGCGFRKNELHMPPHKIWLLLLYPHPPRMQAFFSPFSQFFKSGAKFSYLTLDNFIPEQYDMADKIELERSV
jgi:hypothetical protein